MFQEQRLLHTKRLKKEIIKLERMEHDMAANAIRSEKVQKPILLHNRSFRLCDLFLKRGAIAQEKPCNIKI